MYSAVVVGWPVYGVVVRVVADTLTPAFSRSLVCCLFVNVIRSQFLFSLPVRWETILEGKEVEERYPSVRR